MTHLHHVEEECGIVEKRWPQHKSRCPLRVSRGIYAEYDCSAAPPFLLVVYLSRSKILHGSIRILDIYVMGL
jgi:hypothetical protein